MTTTIAPTLCIFFLIILSDKELSSSFFQQKDEVNLKSIISDFEFFYLWLALRQVKNENRILVLYIWYFCHYIFKFSKPFYLLTIL